MSFRDDQDALRAQLEALKQELDTARREHEQQLVEMHAELEEERRTGRRLVAEARAAATSPRAPLSKPAQLGIGFVCCALGFGSGGLIFQGRPEKTCPSVEQCARPAAGVWRREPTLGLAIGVENAPVQIELFTDLQCQFCATEHAQMMLLMARFPGKLHLRARDYPLSSQARRAALYARCAAKQDLYWPYVNELLRSPARLDEERLKQVARQTGLAPAPLGVCVSSALTERELEADLEEGRRRGVSGVPVAFVNGEKVQGVKPLQEWEDRIRALIDRPTSSPSSAPAR